MRPARMPSTRRKLLPWYYIDRSEPTRAVDNAAAIGFDWAAVGTEAQVTEHQEELEEFIKKHGGTSQMAKVEQAERDARIAERFDYSSKVLQPENPEADARARAIAAAIRYEAYAASLTDEDRAAHAAMRGRASKRADDEQNPIAGDD